MKNQLSSSDEDDYDTSTEVYRWWRSSSSSSSSSPSTKYDESIMKLMKLDVSNISSLTPKLKVVREMERLGLVAMEGLDELRHKLVSYKSGDFWVPTGGIKKEEMDIPPVITIVLVGFSCSGKSSLVNLMYSVLGRCGLIPFAQTSGGSSKYTNLFLEEHNVLRSMRSGFCVYDTRGLDYQQIDQSLEEVSDWMTDGVHHNQLCLRPGDYISSEDELETSSSTSYSSSSKFLKRRVNCAMVVANVAEIYKAFKAGDFKPLDATRALFCCPALRKCNENPILILTHGDMISTEERIEGRLKICEYLGVAETTGVYDITCLTQYGFLADESDPVTAYALTEAVYRALLISDRSHLPQKNYQDYAIYILTWLLCLLGDFFAFLAHLFPKLGTSKRNNKLRL